MMKKIYFPRSILPITTILSELVNFLIMILVFFIIIWVTGYGVSIDALIYLPVDIVLLFMFTLGVILALSALDVYFRDVAYIVGVLLMAWIWITPIMYSADGIENELLLFILKYNPMTYFTELFQDTFYWKIAPSVSLLVICTVIAVSSLIVGIVIFRNLEKDFAEVL